MSKTNGYQVLNQNGWNPTTDVEFLASINNPSLGPRHLPIQHGEVLQMFLEKADQMGISIKSSSGFLSPEKDKYIYIAETDQNEEVSYSLGFINFNDRSKSFVGLASERIHKWRSVCFSGVFSPSRTRHTLNVEERLEGKIDGVFGQYEKYITDMKSAMGFLKESQINDANLGRILVNLHRKQVMGATNITRIINEYDNPDFEDVGNNGWKVYGSFSEVIKRLKNPIDSITIGNEGRKVILDSLGF